MSEWVVWVFKLGHKIEWNKMWNVKQQGVMVVCGWWWRVYLLVGGNLDCCPLFVVESGRMRFLSPPFRRLLSTNAYRTKNKLPIHRWKWCKSSQFWCPVKVTHTFALCHNTKSVCCYCWSDNTTPRQSHDDVRAWILISIQFIFSFKH
jgi:hypothetical protein